MGITRLVQPGSSLKKRKKMHGSAPFEENFYAKANVHSVNIINSVYRGRADRLQRYHMYDWMDKDSDVSRALDIIAEHCTEKDENKRYFTLNWRSDEATEEISKTVLQSMDQWAFQNQFFNRMTRIIRNVIKYGDLFLFRDANTFELYSLHPKQVLGAVIEKESGDILGWVVKNFRFNIESMEIDLENEQYNNMIKAVNGSGTGARNAKIIPAAHIIQLSLSEGKFSGASYDEQSTDRYQQMYPFGESWLEQIYKTFKQRELLEDAAIIHRVQRAPTRNVWYIDVGMNRNDRSSWIVENFKNELNEKRIPQFLGSNAGAKSVDSVYNPISQLEDYFIPISASQRGSKVEKLEGVPWNDMPDLDYLKKKMMAALRVPYAWMQGSQDGGSVFNDGRAGVAYQEEIEFSRFCLRIQNNLIMALDHEFKMFCKWRDIDFNPGDFMLSFCPPDDYEKSKQLSRLNEAVPVFNALLAIPFISARFAMKYGMQFTDDQILENERLYREENFPLFTPGMNSGGGGAMGGDMPFGAEPPMGGSGPPQDNGQMGGAEGADVGGMAPAGTSAGAAAYGGAMESININSKKIQLIEQYAKSKPKMPWTINYQKNPATTKLIKEEKVDFEKVEIPSKKNSEEGFAFSRDDQGIMQEDPLHGNVMVSLSELQKIRRAYMSKRIDKQRRLNSTLQMYKKAPAEPSGMGGM